MVLLTIVLSLALCITMIQPQLVYAEPSNQSDQAIKDRLIKQYSLTPHEEIEPYHSLGDYGISIKIDKTVLTLFFLLHLFAFIAVSN